MRLRERADDKVVWQSTLCCLLGIYGLGRRCWWLLLFFKLKLRSTSHHVSLRLGVTARKYLPVPRCCGVHTLPTISILRADKSTSEASGLSCCGKPASLPSDGASDGLGLTLGARVVLYIFRSGRNRCRVGAAARTGSCS